ncbi:X protein [Shayang Fly Virus 2]|uniref:X protein n=1 Tax=Shayang Fly Virus 2 TaxID=1608066 RepID=A0A0B5KXE6_9RHAB|nr:X protein [Shayang Fly Virus 2]AJG39123.1 X protein [Shayang Fly Virus 2]
MNSIIIILLICVLSARARILEIECSSANATSEDPYDVLSTEYHGWIKLNDPFYVEQTINIHAVYNTTHNLTYTQTCETNDKDFQTPGFIDPGKLQEIHRKVVTKISGFLVSTIDNVIPGKGKINEEDSAEDEVTPNLLFDFIPLTTTTTTTTPRPKRTLEAKVTVRNWHRMKQVFPDIRRDLALVEDEDEMPEAYVPPKRKSYTRYVKARLASLVKSNHPLRKPTDREAKKDILRARIFKLERQRDQVALLFSIQILYAVKEPSPLCQKLKSVRAAIKCFAHHYDELMESPDYHNTAHYFHELTNLEAKIAAESKLFYIYSDEPTDIMT